VPSIEVGFANGAHITSCAIKPAGSAGDLEVVIRNRKQARSYKYPDCLCLLDFHRITRFCNQMVLHGDGGRAIRSRLMLRICTPTAPLMSPVITPRVVFAPNPPTLVMKAPPTDAQCFGVASALVTNNRTHNPAA
jgi:hypothetical protein